MHSATRFANPGTRPAPGDEIDADALETTMPREARRRLGLGRAGERVWAAVTHDATMRRKNARAPRTARGPLLWPRPFDKRVSGREKRRSSAPVSRTGRTRWRSRFVSNRGCDHDHHDLRFVKS